MAKTFKEKVLKVVAQIPRGQVMTYKEVATRAGNARACQAVGQLMKRNCDPNVPCHRVIGSNGWIGGFNRGLPEKIRRLGAEGVNIKALQNK
tara:strand:+ start:251 stop:526 length:276 start_codon:yes stop_codon:yes gene_type:complete